MDTVYLSSARILSNEPHRGADVAKPSDEPRVFASVIAQLWMRSKHRVDSSGYLARKVRHFAMLAPVAKLSAASKNFPERRIRAHERTSVLIRRVVMNLGCFACRT
jgi:hypothetical protein